MRFDIVTIFPEFFSGPLDYGIVRRAREAGIAEVQVHDLRAWTRDRHRTVDDRPFGGGEGMVMKPEPLFEAVESILGMEPEGFFAASPPRRAGRASAQNDKGGGLPAGTAIVLLSAAGKLFRQETARRFAALERIVLLCGRYEGVDERVAQHLATDELSIGDFVLSGGELAAALVVDAVTRLLPGALGNEASSVHESFSPLPAPTQPAPVPQKVIRDSWFVPRETSLVTNHETRATNHGILDCPHYTRPQDFRGWAVPEVLVSGHHEQVRRWRRRAALAKTLRHRPELLAGAALTEEDAALLDELRAEAARG